MDNPEQEPTMIGDGASPIAIHTLLEDITAQPMEPENVTFQPMELVVTMPTTDPPIGEVVNALEVPEGTDASPPLVPVTVPPGTERELCHLEINEEVPNLTRGRM